MAWATHVHLKWFDPKWHEQPMTIWTGLTQSGMNNPHTLKSNPVHLKMFDPKWYEQTTCAQNAMSNLSNPSSFEVVWPKIRLEGTGSLLVYIKRCIFYAILGADLSNKVTKSFKLFWNCQKTYLIIRFILALIGLEWIRTRKFGDRMNWS